MLLLDCDAVSGWVVTDVSKDRIVFIFRAQQSSKSDFLDHVLLLKMLLAEMGAFPCDVNRDRLILHIITLLCVISVSYIFQTHINKRQYGCNFFTY